MHGASQEPSKKRHKKCTALHKSRVKSATKNARRFTTAEQKAPQKMHGTSQEPSKKCHKRVESRGHSRTVCLGMVPALCHPFSAYNLEVSFTFLQSLWDIRLRNKILTSHGTKLSSNGSIIGNVEVTLILYPLPMHTESTTVIF